MDSLMLSGLIGFFVCYIWIFNRDKKRDYKEWESEMKRKGILHD